MLAMFGKFMGCMGVNSFFHSLNHEKFIVSYRVLTEMTVTFGEYFERRKSQSF